MSGPDPATTAIGEDVQLALKFKAASKAVSTQARTIPQPCNAHSLTHSLTHYRPIDLSLGEAGAVSRGC